MWSMKEIDSLLNSIDYNALWEGFSKSKYAIYNDKKFYINDIAGLDINSVREDFYFVGDVDERFIGNSAISIDGNYIAIYNEAYIRQDMDIRELVSLIMHEMFHCFQFTKGEKRFPNELLGIDYPITIENIKLRILERRYLLEAYLENNKKEKTKLLSNFYNIRDKREKLMGNIIEYEKAIETVEGTAVYVEFKAINKLNPNVSLEKYLKGFTDINQENMKVRQSTFNQGLLLGLIADEYIADWKKGFLDREEFLSDFIKDQIELLEVRVDYDNKDLVKIEACISKWNTEIDKVFDQFQSEDRLNYLQEGFQITAFDPMNIIKRDKEMIHKNFLRIRIGGQEQLLKGPVKVAIGEHFFDVKNIQW